VTALDVRAALVLSLAASPLAAQAYTLRPAIQPEVRAEVAVARRLSAVGMAGLNIPLGLYVRAGINAGMGVADSRDGAALALRADAAARFLLDPFAQHTWGPYAGGGLTVRRDGGERARAGLLFILGVEGRRSKRWTPALEAALGEGARLAVVLRKARENGR
jgi:hypothetical protein